MTAFGRLEDSVEVVGTRIHRALSKKPHSWVLGCLGALYWRAIGNGPYAIDCLRVALLHAPQDSKVGPPTTAIYVFLTQDLWFCSWMISFHDFVLLPPQYLLNISPPQYLPNIYPPQYLPNISPHLYLLSMSILSHLVSIYIQVTLAHHLYIAYTSTQSGQHFAQSWRDQ